MERWDHVEVVTRAYLLTQAPQQTPPRVALWGFHGYAEHPRTALRALQASGRDDALLVAPMGQHHLYNREGDVVASWMTRHERGDQIRQIVAFLASAHSLLVAAHGELPVIAAGFSQGAAAAYRLACLSGVPVSHLHVLAGQMPPEVAAGLRGWSPVPVTLHWGSDDRRVPRDTLERDRDLLRAAGWPVDLRVHPGGHEWLPGALRVIGEK